jgi:hypothetical protein
MERCRARFVIAAVVMRAVVTTSRTAANAAGGPALRKPPSNPFRSSAMALERGIRRRLVRSCPRLERLEGRFVLSTFQVNTTLDTVAVDLQTGKDAAGHISLRSAIMAADSRGGSNTINLPGGAYTLTIAGANEDASATGDLDITSNLTIKGAGSSPTRVAPHGIVEPANLLAPRDGSEPVCDWWPWMKGPISRSTTR